MLAYCYLEVAHNMPQDDYDKKCLGDTSYIEHKMNTNPMFFVVDAHHCVLVMDCSLCIGLLKRNCSLWKHKKHQACREYTYSVFTFIVTLTFGVFRYESSVWVFLHSSCLKLFSVRVEGQRVSHDATTFILVLALLLYQNITKQSYIWNTKTASDILTMQAARLARQRLLTKKIALYKWNGKKTQKKNKIERGRNFLYILEKTQK